MNYQEKTKIIISHIEVVCDALYHNNFGDSMEKVPKLFEEILELLEELLGIKIKEINASDLEGALERLSQGWNEKDHVYIADVLTFEILPVIKSVV